MVKLVSEGEREVEEEEEAEGGLRGEVGEEVMLRMRYGGSRCGKEGVVRGRERGKWNVMEG